MTQRTLDSHGSSLSLLFACGVLACTSLACKDERLRELGYTSNDVTATDPGSFEPEQCEGALLTADAVIAAAAADAAAAPAASRPFLRYLSIANLVARDACPDELERARLGVARLLNSVSLAPSAVAPRVGGPRDSVLAIDLRDYALTSPVEVEGRSYADGWEALIGESTYGVELTGEAADALALATGTRVPVLQADAFLLGASTASFYYALLGVPDTLGELRAAVGLPGELDPVANGAVRTAIENSRILRADGDFRVLDRYSIDSGTAGTYWEATAIDLGTFFADPLRTQPDRQRLITYTLPNDFFAFAIYGADGQRRASGELVLDTNRDDFTAHVFDSCANCHAQGLIPGIDRAGEVILSHADQFEPEVVEAYQSGPSIVERAEQFQADSVPYQQALANIGIEASGGDPFVTRLFSVVPDLSLEDAAADLLVTPEALLARLGELSPELRALGLDLNVSRERFGEHFRAAYCLLHAEDDNPPVCAP